MTNAKLYTRAGYVLGARCDVGHGGNRRYSIATKGFAECCGCRHYVALRDLPRFASRAEAVAADAQFRATWPLDTASAVLANERR